MTDYLIFRAMAFCCMILSAAFMTLFILIVRGIVNKIKASKLKKRGPVNELIYLEKIEPAKTHLAV